MNFISPYIYFLVSFILCLLIIGNRNYFDSIHQNKWKTVITMSLIISIIIFIIALSDYYFERKIV